MNPEVADIVRDAACGKCRMGDLAETICVTGRGATRARVMVVGKMPNSKAWQQELDAHLMDAGLSPNSIFHTSAVKCRNFERQPTKTDVKACKSYLDQEIDIVKPRFILALGNEALQALTGRSGITKYRGQVIKRGNVTIIPTLSPSSVKRNPGQLQGWLADLRFFANKVQGKSSGIPDPEFTTIERRDQLDKLIRLLSHATRVTYDVETTGDNEFEPDARIISLALTITYKHPATGNTALKNVFIPLFHPESPWRSKWRAVLRYLAPALEAVPVHEGHNAKYDARWMRRFGVRMRTDEDSLLMAHAADENRQKGLKPQAQSRLGVAPWGIDTKDLLHEPLDKIAIYNVKDTYYTRHIVKDLRKELRTDKPRQYRLYKNLLIPASEAYVEAERRGVWMDRERLQTNTKVTMDMLADVEQRLMEYVPEPGTHGWPVTGKRGKPAEVNFNASNWARWWLFEYLGMPVLKRGKDKDDGSPGAPSMAEDVIVDLREATQHPALELLMERSKWEKYRSSFLSTYEEQLDEADRIHTSYKLHGTVTGRTSSGKVDEEKVTATKGKRRRGVNLQQVPRDPFIRGLFGAAPGSLFVEADFSQIELRIAAWIAREEHMLHLYRIGADIHLATAARTMGIPESQVTKEDRKKAKAVNFGFLYGMSWGKFIQTAWQNYGVRYTEAEAQATRIAFFDTYPGLVKWHAKQRSLVRKYGRVEMPTGRVRHLPDIYSPDKSVQAEAERQAINSPVQGFASDLALLSMILIHQQFLDQGIEGHVIGTVHDAVNFEIAEKHVGKALPIIKHTMENLPLQERFRIDLDVPIVADLKVGTHWGDAKELNEAEVYDWKGMAA